MTDLTTAALSALQLDRRAAVASIAAALGIAALPLDALAAPAKGKATARFLAPARFAVLEAVSDTLFPHSDSVGALDAKVPARLDALLVNWAAPAKRDEVAAALDRIEAASRAQTGKGFVALMATQREAVLRPHDKAALVPAPPPANAPPGNAFAQAIYVADQGYFIIKQLVIDLYYFSPEAVEAELVYEHVPGKFEPSIKLTPQSRPYLGTA